MLKYEEALKNHHAPVPTCHFATGAQSDYFPQPKVTMLTIKQSRME